ncbi:hypothetical protein [Streptomyces violaceusniger]|uniref:hypothetical protein n=1 Tax=Streptomyces violaceusniger TaxID=68280 RepID=UPI0031E3CDDF
MYSRGLVQQALGPLGPVRAAVGVAVLFGAGHIQNFLFFGDPLDDTLWQMLAAGFFGLASPAPRCATRSARSGRWWSSTASTTSSRSARPARPRTGGRRAYTPSTWCTACGCCAGTVRAGRTSAHESLVAAVTGGAWTSTSERSGVTLTRHPGRCQTVPPAPHRAGVQRRGEL